MAPKPPPLPWHARLAGNVSRHNLQQHVACCLAFLMPCMYWVDIMTGKPQLPLCGLRSSDEHQHLRRNHHRAISRARATAMALQVYAMPPLAGASAQQVR